LELTFGNSTEVNRKDGRVCFGEEGIHIFQQLGGGGIGRNAAEETLEGLVSDGGHLMSTVDGRHGSVKERSLPCQNA